MNRHDFVVGIKAGLDGAVACLDSQFSLRWAFDMPVVTRGGRRRVDGAELARLLRENLPGIREEPRVPALDYREHDSLMDMPSEPNPANSRGSRGALTVVYLEHACGETNMSVAHSFARGLSCGVVEGVLAALKMPVEAVSPAAWKKRAGLAKNDSVLDKARELYPEVALMHKRDAGKAEAMLIARFGGLEKT